MDRTDRPLARHLEISSRSSGRKDCSRFLRGRGAIPPAWATWFQTATSVTPNAWLIVASVSPACRRFQSSSRTDRSAMNTTLVDWCCADGLRPPRPLFLDQGFVRGGDLGELSLER